MARQRTFNRAHRVAVKRKKSVTPEDFQRDLFYLALRLATIMVCHIFGMMWFEHLNFAQALWLTLTTITTVGYGDLSAASIPGQITTVLFIYIGGIYLVSSMISTYFDYKGVKKDIISRGYWEWNMKNHIVFLNMPPENTEWFMKKIAIELGNKHSDMHKKEKLIVTEMFPKGMPPSLLEAGFVYQNDIPNSEQALLKANIAEASHILIFVANKNPNKADAETFDLTSRVRSLTKNATIIAEICNDENHNRTKSAGANLIIRPNRWYPEITARALIAPGVEQLISSVFTTGGDECVRYNLHLEDITWKTIVTKLLNDGIGLALGYEDSNGNIIINPDSNTTVDCYALFVLVNENNAMPQHEFVELDFVT